MSRFVSYFSLTMLFTLCACFVDYAFVIVVIKESYYYYYYIINKKTLGLVTSLSSATYVRWKRGTARIRPSHDATEAIGRYLLHARRAHSSKPAAAGLLVWALAETDEQVVSWTDRPTDTVPFHRPCSAYIVSSAKKIVMTSKLQSIITKVASENLFL